MAYYSLNLDCSKLKTNGDLDGYSYDNTQPISNPNNPKGQVWWQSSDGQNWTPIAGSDANKPGDPKHASPVVANGDTVWVAIRDQNNQISSVTFAMVFGKRERLRIRRPLPARSRTPREEPTTPTIRPSSPAPGNRPMGSLYAGFRGCPTLAAAAPT